MDDASRHSSYRHLRICRDPAAARRQPRASSTRGTRQAHRARPALAGGPRPVPGRGGDVVAGHGSPTGATDLGVITRQRDPEHVRAARPRIRSMLRRVAPASDVQPCCSPEVRLTDVPGPATGGGAPASVGVSPQPTGWTPPLGASRRTDGGPGKHLPEIDPGSSQARRTRCSRSHPRCAEPPAPRRARRRAFALRARPPVRHRTDAPGQRMNTLAPGTHGPMIG